MQDYGEINPEKITKPLQLMATLLLSLLLLVGAFLYASSIKYPYKGINVIYAGSAILIIPLFLIVIFILMTRYRVELQGDSSFCKYKFEEWKQAKKNIITYEKLKGELK